MKCVITVTMVYVPVCIAQCSHSGNHLSVTVLIIAVLLLLLLSVFKLLLNPKVKSTEAQKHMVILSRYIVP